MCGQERGHQEGNKVTDREDRVTQEGLQLQGGPRVGPLDRAVMGKSLPSRENRDRGVGSEARSAEAGEDGSGVGSWPLREVGGSGGTQEWGGRKALFPRTLDRHPPPICLGPDCWPMALPPTPWQQPVSTLHPPLMGQGQGQASQAPARAPTPP